jgi:hypothetical protein
VIDRGQRSNASCVSLSHEKIVGSRSAFPIKAMVAASSASVGAAARFPKIAHP